MPRIKRLKVCPGTAEDQSKHNSELCGNIMDDQKKMVAGELGNIVKYFALGLESTACNTIMPNPDLSKTVKKLVIKEMDNESEEFCKKKNSMLCQTKPEELLAFKKEKFMQEI